MNILYIWDADYPWDIRVQKICTSLLHAGHEVHVAARNLKKSPVYECMQGLHIHRLTPWKYDLLNYALTFPAFFSPVWLTHLRKIARRCDIDLIIVRDLPMAVAGIWTGQRRKIPVIFDMAEDYVSMLRAGWENSQNKGLDFFVRNPHLAKLVEKYALPRVQHTLVVAQEMIEVAVAAGGDADAITIVSNTPTTDVIARACRKQTSASEPTCYKAIYTGGLEQMRGIHLVLDAIPKILKTIPDFLFIVIGDGPTLTSLKARATANGIAEHVEWLGWVDHAHIFDHIAESDVGIIPHLVSRHVDTTIPNKLFDYMACGIPVIASDARPMKRILESHQAGIAFASGNVDSLAQAVTKIHASPVDYGSNGRKAVLEHFSWKQDEKQLLQAIAQSTSRANSN